MPDPTPGQYCYEAYWAILPPTVWDAWHTLTRAERARWEDAAQAVRRAERAERLPALERGSALGQTQGDDVIHYVADVAHWLTCCGESQGALSGTDRWANVTCPACHAQHEAQPGAPGQRPRHGSARHCARGTPPVLVTPCPKGLCQ